MKLDSADADTHKSSRDSQNDDKLWHELYKFSVVRNPWSKAVSEYHWYLRYGPHCTFKTWVSSLENRIALNHVINIAEIGHNLPQHYFLFDESENLLVDEIIKFENLEEEFYELLRQRNIKATLPKDVQTSSMMVAKDFRQYYDENDIETIERIYKKDLSLLFYDKTRTFS